MDQITYHRITSTLLQFMNLRYFHKNLRASKGSNFRSKYYAKINQLINFYFPWNHQKSYGFLMIAVGMEKN